MCIPKLFTKRRSNLAIAVMLLSTCTQLHSQQNTVIIELFPRIKHEPRAVVEPGQTVYWSYYNFLGRYDVKGIAFPKGQSPCEKDSSEGSCKIRVDAVTAANPTANYKYKFCTDFRSDGENCGSNFALAGELKVGRSGGQTTAPTGDVNVVLTKQGLIHQLVRPKDTILWYNQDGKAIQVNITSKWPCTGWRTGPTYSCQIPNEAKASDNDYECSNADCDPTFHVRSAGQGVFLYLQSFSEIYPLAFWSIISILGSTTVLGTVRLGQFLIVGVKRVVALFRKK